MVQYLRTKIPDLSINMAAAVGLRWLQQQWKSQQALSLSNQRGFLISHKTGVKLLAVAGLKH
jgi:hypothetical protein